MTNDPPSFYSVKTCAQIFDRSKKTIRKWCRQGTIEAKKDTVTGQLYIPEQAVQDRLEDLGDRGPPGELPDEFTQDPPEPDQEPGESLEDPTPDAPELGDDEGEPGDESEAEASSSSKGGGTILGGSF